MELAGVIIYQQASASRIDKNLLRNLLKFREHLKKAHGIDIAQSSNMQLNELLANWKR